MRQQSIDALLDFMNSHHHEGVTDCFESAARARERLVEIGQAEPGVAISEEDARLLRRVRDALNGLFEGCYVAERVTFDEVAEELPLRLRIVTPEPRATLVGVRPGAAEVAARALGLAFEAMIDGTWRRVKTCRNKDDCCWAFVDRSKNGSRVWCEMATCGARAKARAFRARRRGATKPAPR